MEGKDAEAEIHPLKHEEGKSAEGQAVGAEKENTPKKPGRLSRWRTAAFFLSLFLCLAVVFAFSFVVPCPVRPVSQRNWSRTFANAAAYGFMEVRDVNQDRVQDIVFAFKASSVAPKSDSTNSSCSSEGFASPCAFLTAYSGTNGSTLWQRPVAEDLLLLDCSFEHNPSPACLLVGSPGFLAALSLETGQTIWQEAANFGANSTVLNPLLKIPDVDRDGVMDILVFTEEGEKIDMSFYSGNQGTQMGSSKRLHLPGRIGHLLHVTNTGACYVLFYTATALYSYSVEEFYHVAVGYPEATDSGFVEDPYRITGVNGMSHPVPLLSSGEIRYVTKMPSKSGSDILVARSVMLELVDGQLLKSLWVVDIPPILSEPVPGYYKADDVSVVVEGRVSSEKKKLLIVHGSSRDTEWEVELLTGPGSLRPAILPTADQRSLFLFWGTYQRESNGTGPRDGSQQHLYLFHPAFPNVLLEIRNQTEPAVAFQGVLFERSRHACYVLLTGPRAGSAPGQVALYKQKLKEDIKRSRVVRLTLLAQEAEEDIRERFARMRYRSLR